MGWEEIKFKRMMIFSIYNDDDGDGDYGDIMGLLFRIRWCYDVARRIGVCQGCPISPRRGPYLARNATIFIIVALEIIIAKK